MNIEKDAFTKFDLAHFSLSDMTECGRVLRRMNENAKNMEEAADRITRYLYEHLIDKQTGEKACALVRLFKTHPYAGLNEGLQRFARGVLPAQTMSPETKCLTLLATIGERPEWNSRHSSKGHKAIPLLSEEAVRQFPMISNLVRQMGLEVKAVINPDKELLLDVSQRHFNVFYVPDASGSPYVPAQQDFVLPCKIKTVLGMGGALPTGDVFVVILFTKVPINREAADLFKTLALNIKIALLQFQKRVF